MLKFIKNIILKYVKLIKNKYFAINTEKIYKKLFIYDK